MAFLERIKRVCSASVACIALAFIAVAPDTAHAIPLFAQRYQLRCGACHSVLPELNSFGEAFRARGYRLSLPKHGTTGIAFRYQLEYEKDPPVGTRRFSPGGVVLSNADVGAISAFVHYNLGAGGGPSGLFLGYLATYNPHTQTLYRAGLFELPLLQSPGQRLDDLQAYGYYGARVGLNDLSLASPRWGAQAERAIGASRIDVVIDDGEYKGSAYGGKPVATGDTTAAQAPEYALFFRTPVGENAIVGGDVIAGTRRISVFGTSPFSDAYRRDGLFARLRVAKAELQGEQWFGADANADGFGTRVGSSGGYLRFKYYPTAHAYVGVRYDAFATPFVTRDVTWYGAFHVTPHARFLLQDVHTIGGATALGAALTVGAPWPPKL